MSTHVLGFQSFFCIISIIFKSSSSTTPDDVFKARNDIGCSCNDLDVYP